MLKDNKGLESTKLQGPLTSIEKWQLSVAVAVAVVVVVVVCCRMLLQRCLLYTSDAADDTPC
eukprot:4749219-Amphidinium_carterae.1